MVDVRISKKQSLDGMIYTITFFRKIENVKITTAGDKIYFSYTKGEIVLPLKDSMSRIKTDNPAFSRFVGEYEMLHDVKNGMDYIDLNKKLESSIFDGASIPRSDLVSSCELPAENTKKETATENYEENIKENKEEENMNTSIKNTSDEIIKKALIALLEKEVENNETAKEALNALKQYI